MKTGDLLGGMILGLVRFLGLSIALACLGFILWGVWALAQGIWGLVQHGAYDGEPLWKFAGLDPSRNTILNIDKAWWFILGGSAALVSDMALVGWLIRHLRKDHSKG